MSVFVLTTLIVYCIFALGRQRQLIAKGIDTITTEQKKIQDISIAYFVVGACLLAYVTGQRFAFGDTVVYLNGFQDINITFQQALGQFSFGNESVFVIIQAFIKQYISTDSRIFLEIITFITIIPQLYFLYNYSGDFKFAFLLFVLSGCWEHSMNGLRQYLACSIMLMAITCIESRKWYIYIPVAIFAAQIHTSAYIFILLYFIANKPAWGKTTKIILFIGIGLLITYPITGSFMSNWFAEGTDYGEKYSNSEFDYGINVFRLIVLSIPIILAFINRKSMVGKYKYYNVVFNMSLFCVISTLIGIFSVVYARMNLYFETCNVMLLVWNLNSMAMQEKYKWIKNAAIICYIAFFLYQLLVTYNMNWYERYLFFCNDWKDASWI